MPVNRLCNRKPSRPHANQPYPSPTRAQASHLKLNPSAAAEVIVLSSDNEDESMGKSKVRLSRRPKKKPSKKPFFEGEVWEISSSSSDERPTLSKRPKKGSEGPSSHRERHTEHLEHQLSDHRLQLDSLIKQLKEQDQELEVQRQEIAGKREEIDARCQEIESQRQQLSALQLKEVLGLIDVIKLEDMLSCDICANLMHSPYILVDCGHCYCEECLKGWFNETLTKYMRTYPMYRMNRDPMPRNFPHLLQTLHPYISSLLRTQLLGLYNNSRQQQPEYTCPCCRREVTMKPVVNYAVKEVASVVASTLGQSHARVQSSTLRLGQHMGPFDGFFP